MAHPAQPHDPNYRSVYTEENDGKHQFPPYLMLPAAYPFPVVFVSPVQIVAREQIPPSQGSTPGAVLPLHSTQRVSQAPAAASSSHSSTQQAHASRRASQTPVAASSSHSSAQQAHASRRASQTSPSACAVQSLAANPVYSRSRGNEFDQDFQKLMALGNYEGALKLLKTQPHYGNRSWKDFILQWTLEVRVKGAEALRSLPLESIKSLEPHNDFSLYLHSVRLCRQLISSNPQHRELIEIFGNACLDLAWNIIKQPSTSHSCINYSKLYLEWVVEKILFLWAFKGEDACCEISELLFSNKDPSLPFQTRIEIYAVIERPMTAGHVFQEARKAFLEKFEKAKKNPDELNRLIKNEWRLFKRFAILLAASGQPESATQFLIELETQFESYGPYWLLRAQLLSGRTPEEIHEIRRLIHASKDAFPRSCKSGEVFCEEARWQINPVISGILNSNLREHQKERFQKARELLESSLEFTCQFGDSYIEYFRLIHLEWWFSRQILYDQFQISDEERAVIEAGNPPPKKLETGLLRLKRLYEKELLTLKDRFLENQPNCGVLFDQCVTISHLFSHDIWSVIEKRTLSHLSKMLRETTDERGRLCCALFEKYQTSFGLRYSNCAAWLRSNPGNRTALVHFGRKAF